MGGISVLVLLGLLSGLYMLDLSQFFFAAVFYLIITYVFEALTVMGMRERRGEHVPALAWIPFYNKYLLGKIVGKRFRGVFRNPYDCNDWNRSILLSNIDHG